MQCELVKLSRLPSLSVLVLQSKPFKKFSLHFQLTISNNGDAEAVGLAIVNTILGKYLLSRAKHCLISTPLISGGSAGGIVALILGYIEQKKWSYLVTLNGALTGKYRF